MIHVLALTLCWAEMDCLDHLVSGPQGVPDSALSASSSYDQTSGAACGRLYMYQDRSSTGCQAPNAATWCSLPGDTEPHIQVEFHDLKRIVGVVTQQRKRIGSINDIRTYHVLYSEDGEDWEYVRSEGVNQIFDVPADSDDDTEHYHTVNPPVVHVALYVRIRPLTWVRTPTVPCLRFDVIGCTHDTGRRRFAYLPLPAGSISDNDVIKKQQAKDLGDCSLQCHRDVTCRSFSYSDEYKECEAYSVNKCSQLSARVGEQSISEKQYLYYFDMTNIDLYMTTDPTTGLIYKVITRKYSKEDAMTACADLEMRLLVVNSVDKLSLVQRVVSASLVLEQRRLWVSGGWYEVDGVTKWWDGEDPPQPLSDKLVQWDTMGSPGYSQCLFYTKKNVRSGDCTIKLSSICEK